MATTRLVLGVIVCQMWVTIEITADIDNVASPCALVLAHILAINVKKF